MAQAARIGLLVFAMLAIFNPAAARAAPDPPTAKLRGNCPQGYIGPIPHFSDCTKYINCTPEGESFEDCPIETTFSPLLNICYYAYNVEAGCNGR